MSWPQIMCRKLRQHAANIYIYISSQSREPKNCKAWLSKWSSGAQPFHVNPKHHGKKTGIVSRLEERGAEQKWRRKEGMGCALPTPGPQERSAFHIKELEERRLEQGHLLRASFPKARSMLPANRAQQEKILGATVLHSHIQSSRPLTASMRRGKCTLSVPVQLKRVSGLSPTDTMPCGGMRRSWSVK